MSEISRQKIDIVFNGEAMAVEKGITVMDLLHILEFVTSRFLVVINDHVVPKSAYGTTQLELGDHCDTMSPISGG